MRLAFDGVGLAGDACAEGTDSPLLATGDLWSAFDGTGGALEQPATTITTAAPIAARARLIGMRQRSVRDESYGCSMFMTTLPVAFP
jgi:hypothetical protein